jgi:mannose-6-phosphate isomerase
MHLLEAFVALHAATGRARWRRGAEHIASLCVRSFLHSETGALLEYFDAELQPAAGEEGRIVEPGHCFEWAWLFEFLAQRDVPEAIQISDRMTAFARKYGLDPTRGVAINEVTTDGAIRNPAARLWPQTERLKAALARFRRTGDEEERKEAAAAYAGLV